ncbi:MULTISPECIES: CDP-glycerol glycerophosphotransferase family protein [unclassified Bacillus (in: firmicutes)]|uniref:CDP-glycerol glycerophosphotransferase family protein n=1 Tax=unclassified Bacillus (in: firmicutes) TaxID=185979 RepID=UPI00080AE78A|nr:MULTISPECIES: CDP-glycerol glycerophosphotransferase family protein [unclassified Bacillus (in: firmicutes)]OCA84926.1 hypothetical protein A8L44_09620 [Bacillus sp. FJAT-27986]
MKHLKMIPTLLTKYSIQFAYALSSLFFKVDPNKITIATYRSNELEGNLSYIANEIDRNDPRKKRFVLAKKFNSSIGGKVSYFFHLIRASFHLATSRFFIVDDFYFPIYVVKPRNGSEFVQLWHAAGAFKKFGWSTIGKDFGPSEDYLKTVKVHSNYSRVYVSSEKVIPAYAEAFNMPEEQIFPLGVPRTDYFYNHEEHKKLRIRFYQQYPQLDGKKLILYAPTFRGKSHYQEEFTMPVDLELMRKKLGDEYAFIIHLHPYMKLHLSGIEQYSDFVIHMKKGYNIQELLVLADILVTDYSSVIFDYSLLKRPIAFIADDLEEYLKERDFYYPYLDFIPGPFFTETLPLANWIKEKGYNITKIEEFQQEFFDYTDGRASERIVKHLLSK